MKIWILATAFLISIRSISQSAEPETPKPATIEQIEKQLAEGTHLLDVRTKEEWAEGHLKGATLVPVTEDDFLEKAKAILEKRDVNTDGSNSDEVVVYCRSGKRSAIAAKQLRAAGYTVYDLNGGFTSWQAAGKPVVKPKPTQEK